MRALTCQHINGGYQALALESSTPTILDMFAVIIGINKYPFFEQQNLSGAVADADKMYAYLQKYHPSCDIVNLRDGEATRTTIIDTLQDLSEKEEIRPGDPILIYFAGHGTRGQKVSSDIEPPSSTDADANTGRRGGGPNADITQAGTMIEMICPSDIGPPNAQRKDPIHGIPDTTLSGILNKIASKKGNNIIVIFDCCHSAGATRELQPKPELGMVARELSDPPKYPAGYDDHLFSARGLGPLDGFALKGAGSHVLLAACATEQSAWESKQANGASGFFTTALIELLKSKKPITTYRSLINQLDLPIHVKSQQTPHCYGMFVDRLLFETSELGGSHNLISGFNNNGNIMLKAGIVHGIYKNSRMKIFDHETNNYLGDLTVSSQSLDQPFCSTLDFFEGSFKVPRTFYAKEFWWPIKVHSNYSELEAEIESVIPDFGSIASKVQDLGIQFVDQKDAELLIVVKNEDVFFERPAFVPDSDAQTIQIATCITDRRFRDSMKRSDPAGILSVIIAFYKFNKYLRTTREKGNEITQEELNILQLEDSGFFPELCPTGKNLIDPKTKTCEIVIDSTESVPYGFTLSFDLKRGPRSPTRRPLYPYLFFFDACDLSIKHWYLPDLIADNATSNPGQAPLTSANPLTIGYGENGTQPWQFNLQQGVDCEVGFFKLYITSAYTNLACISQDSPFRTVPDFAMPLATLEARGGGPTKIDIPDSWATKTFTIVQRRKGTEGA